MWNKIRSKYAFSFRSSTHTSAECARGMSILDGRRLEMEGGEGTSQDRVRETRSVWAGSAHTDGGAVQTSKGGKGPNGSANSLLVLRPEKLAGTGTYSYSYSGPESAGFVSTSSIRSDISISG